MPSLNRCALIMAMGLCVSASAMAQTGAAPATSDGPLTTGGFMAWGSLGMQADVGGAVNSSGIGTIGGARSEINTNTCGERYDAALIFRFGGAYNLSPRDQVFAAFSFQQADGFERINDVGNRWTLPLMAGIYVRF